MTTSVDSPAGAETRFLGPRITRRLLDRLAERAVTAAPREMVPVEMPATGQTLGYVPHGGADDVAAAADFLDPWFGRLVTAEASRQWIFM